MKLYKYRELPGSGGVEVERLETMLRRNTFWCARPDTLNDPEEFAWKCRYDVTNNTVELLTEVLVRALNGTRERARERVTAAIASGRLEVLAEPVIAGMIQQCRNDLGLVCFGTSPDNPILWQRYGGNGSGVCVELDAPCELLENQLYRVQYSTAKSIHIDQLLNAFIDTKHVREVYSLALLSKPTIWAPEAEIRFISKLQGVSVHIDGSQITCLTIGDAVSTDVRQTIERIVDSLPYALPVQANVA